MLRITERGELDTNASAGAVVGMKACAQGVKAVADAARVPARFKPAVVLLAVKPQVMDQVAPAYAAYAAAGAAVLLRGSYTAGGSPRVNQPLAFIVPHGTGRLVFTTFHNEAGATPDQIAVLRHFIYLP